MAGKNGGTRMWCPECKDVSVMRVVNPRDIDSYDLYENFSHGYGCFASDPEVNVFHRVRECQQCYADIHYYELDERLMNHFLALRAKQLEASRIFETLPELEKDLHAATKKLNAMAKLFK